MLRLLYRKRMTDWNALPCVVSPREIRVWYAFICIESDRLANLSELAHSVLPICVSLKLQINDRKTQCSSIQCVTWIRKWELKSNWTGPFRINSNSRSICWLSISFICSFIIVLFIRSFMYHAQVYNKRNTITHSVLVRDELMHILQEKFIFMYFSCLGKRQKDRYWLNEDCNYGKILCWDRFVVFWATSIT